ncbi:MAG: dihydrofolate reductase family protein [Saprospiraceae bacterium]
MRKLKLQVQMSADGFIAGPNGEMDWMTWNWSDDLKEYVTSLTDAVDLIVLGRKLAEGFIPAWASQLENPEKSIEDEESIRKMVFTPKVVFTKTMDTHNWDSTELAKGDLATEINNLKNQPGGDIIAYGGGTFVSSLIEAGLIDELYLFINPAAIGAGMSIFKGKTTLTLTGSQAFDCGVVVLQYVPQNN